MTNQESTRKRPSKKDRLTAILQNVEKWKSEGMTGEQIANEKLTLALFDFLIDQDIDTDKLFSTAEEYKNILQARAENNASDRKGKPRGKYKKEYPSDKKALFDNLKKFLTDEQKAEIIEDKGNYREMTFDISGKTYKIILSVPRGKKAE